MKVGNDGELRATMAFTDAHYKAYHPSSTIDYSGRKLDRAPSTTIALGYTHHFPLSNGADVTASLNTRHSTAFYLSDPTQDIRYRQPSFRKSDASIGYDSATGKWNAQLYVKNIEDKITIQSRVPGSFFVSDPRTYGARATYNF